MVVLEGGLCICYNKPPSDLELKHTIMPVILLAIQYICAILYRYPSLIRLHLARPDEGRSSCMGSQLILGAAEAEAVETARGCVVAAVRAAKLVDEAVIAKPRPSALHTSTSF